MMTPADPPRQYDAKPAGIKAGSDSNAPQVTVVMSAYNAIDYIKEAVESILNQTLRSWQMIIVDDGSTDGTGEWLDAIEDPRVTVIHQQNAGQQAASNRAIAMCDTELIAKFDADDVSLPTRLETQLAFMNAHPEVGLLGTQFHYLGSKSHGVTSKLPCDHESIYNELINNRHAICNTTTIFRRNLFHKVGGYWEHNISEDWDLFLRIGEVSRLANIPEPMLLVRCPPTSVNGRRMFESQLHNEFACELARLRAKNSPKIPFDAFWQQHPYRKWPLSMMFRMDCYAVAQYRIAMSDLLSGKPLAGYSRMLFSMICSPLRTLQRLIRICRRNPDPKPPVVASRELPANS